MLVFSARMWEAIRSSDPPEVSMSNTDGRFRNGHGKPIVALDIDGSLGPYHANFLEFAERWLGRKMPGAEEINPGLPLWKHMHATKRTYREVKLAYRQSGAKRWMPVFPGASDLTRRIRRAGAELWICTTRPYLRLDNIDPDTREWLRRNKIQYDAVIYGDNKYEELVRQVGSERIVCILEDLPELVERAMKVGIQNILLMDQPYNRHYVGVGTFVTRVKSLDPESEPWNGILRNIRTPK